MLKPNKKSQSKASGHRFVIIASEYNSRYVDGLLKGAIATLRGGGAREVEVIRVPGAFEIPIVASQLAFSGSDAPDAIVCLGVIIQGETSHAEHIGRAITDALMHLQIAYRVPCIHEVLLVKNEAQAKARCLDPKTNRGVEAAQTAMSMAKTLHKLRERTSLPF